MALIKCLECGQEISDKAVACPKCGCLNSNSVTAVENVDNRKINTKIIVLLITLFVIICISLCIIIKSKNKKSRAEKIIYDDFQVLKEEVGSDIKITDALCFKNEKNVKEDEEKNCYSALIVYTSNGKRKYAGFTSKGEYLGNGEEYVNTVNPTDDDINVALHNLLVEIMIYEYDQYMHGSMNLEYTLSGDYEPVVEESKSGDYERCVIPVSVDKIK